MVVKGGANTQADFVARPTIRDFDYKGRTIKRGVRLYSINVNKIKSQIFSYLKQEDEEAHGYMHFPVGYNEDYFKQLTAETRIKTKDKNGFYR